MSAEREPSRPPYPWGRVALLGLPAAAAGVGFGISPLWGLALAGVAVVVFVGVMVWTVRDGRRRRAAGHTVDLGDLERRILRHARWGVVMVAVSLVLAVVAVTTNGDRGKPVWPILLGPVLLVVTLVWLWVVARVVLPRVRAKQSRDD